ncbi:hypothetical protein GGS23DRAFT_558752 [Durotheca rogersii]|uniref:uncharacterized protein n=1 Tax=Durotheca rogersii TaxID=419775 RepID=UPI00221F847B|nr:uncharacterized protein GGS23DRAFT_558752 [Durotheca rogersii]KAI5865332.1 hypothetical protein GGS23DRAFT_558752 [Durotheca rogersii]
MSIQTRLCSPYEARLAIREDLGFYNAATIAAIYELDGVKFDLTSPSSWVQPLKRSIKEYPSLAIAVKDKGTDKPSYELVPTIDLKHHITILDSSISTGSDGDLPIIEKALGAILDRNFSSSSSPPWNLTILPLPTPAGATTKRVFVSFLSSHSTSDGGAGLAFHKSLLEGLREQAAKGVDENVDFTVTVPSQPIPEPFDTPERLPVAPEFLKALASASGPAAGVWTGSPVFLNESEGLHTRVRLLEIPASVVEGALAASKSHGAKLTGTIHQLIVRALSRALPDGAATSFSSQTAIDLRNAAGVGLQWGIYVSGVSESHPRLDAATLSGPLTQDQWDAAGKLSAKLSEASGRLENQPIGLLKFVPSHRDSMKTKIGAPRDGSYSVSNMLAFDGGKAGGISISNLVVGSSAAVPSAPLSFCIVSVQGGSMIISVNWQPGATGLPVEKEDAFISDIFKSLEGDFKLLSA